MSATLRVVTDPMPGAVPMLEREVRAGVPIAWLVPRCEMPVVVRYNGLWILRRDFERALEDGDCLELHVRPQGGEGSSPLRVILTIALIVAANAAGAAATSAYGATVGAAATAAVTVAGTLAINAIVPLEQAQASVAATASPTYNIALSGNQVRAGEPIPVLYGYTRTFPPFGGEPYSDYEPNEELGIDDQYYHALLVLGHGRYRIRRLEIDDTPLSIYQDVEWRQLEPGEQPTLVKANVINCPEVSGQEILSGRFTGPFTATGPKNPAVELVFDIVFNGLGVADTDGNGPAWGPKQVNLRFDYREINDFGRAIGPWQILDSPVVRAATPNAVRRTFRYALPRPMRVRVRCARTDLKEDRQTIPNQPLWANLRSTLAQPATLAATATHIEIRMRASDQLNGLTQRRIAVVASRLLSVWDGESWSADDVETRSIAWAQCDKWRNPVYGDGLPDNRIDLDTMLALVEVWEARQDRFDYVFDTRMTSIEADQLILGCGRAAPIERLGRLTVVRDEPRTIAATAFGSRSIRPGSLRIGYQFATSVSPDGLILRYFDNRAWNWLEVECPCPGVTEMQRPQYFEARGITGPIHATREGRFIAAAMFYRRKQHAWASEMLGSIPHYGAMVKFAPALQGAGLSADVVDWNAAQRVITLSEPVVFTAGEEHFLQLQRDDGSLTLPMPAFPAADAYSLQLQDEPDFELVLDEPDRERPRAIFGSASNEAKQVLIRSIAPNGVDESGTPIVALDGVNDHPAVHLVDAGLLPSPGQVQDPIDDDGVDEGSGGGGPELPDVISIAQMPDQYTVRRSVPWDNANRLRYCVVGLGFNVDGTTYRIDGLNFASDGAPPALTRDTTWSSDPFQSVWERFAPHEAAVGGLYQVRFRLSRAFPADPNMPRGDALDVWHTLNARREVQLHFDEGNPDNFPFVRGSNESYRRLRLSVAIRETATGVVQETSVIELQVDLQDLISGGG